MAKRESTFINMVVTLLLVTVVAAAALGYVYDLTKGPIAAAKLKAQQEAIKKVLPEFDELGESFKVLKEADGDSLEFFPAFKNGESVGVAIKTYTKKGFSGYISIMAGIDDSGNLSGYEVLEHEETPGLGSKMGVWFNNSEKPNQNVIGKNPKTSKFEVSKDGGDIDAITASTITSRAFLEALNRAFNSYEH
ncbi:MAG: RnfABCDGE type electron transport complex subunit G [Prolixibacteraceae bacterium]|jgi:Na+-translocating ferredoxin:NAD+ oxidoreductase subunit G|nr:RnfABCDGE type electron transport complex subunit G [Prolixibacteraceae bacterium]MBT6006973.1 RnfABCDGE type electron transport complex subunit G [Prolixibacteraceae bacterium]MBT6765943.1 RnfABCDGE type electron transport complex subunit G [Prolixibacteraceae bacterium]MBT6999450.1 RnfABCDGE type electron transport complex subunit G [Prolixibacteraceae bacterium]MBT7394797.1 RnfABCDGE type electron transport complex subunit G [Prolixibacteraceae bacterium]